MVVRYKGCERVDAVNVYVQFVSYITIIGSSSFMIPIVV